MNNEPFLLIMIGAATVLGVALLAMMITGLMDYWKERKRSKRFIKAMEENDTRRDNWITLLGEKKDE